MKGLKNKKKMLLLSSLAGLFILAAGYYSGIFFAMGVSPCMIPPPPRISVDGIALAKIYTWYDRNENGIVDGSESALPNVEIIYPFSSQTKYTDNLGNAETGLFKPGCSCKCWEREYVEVATPEGYRATTALRQDLIGDNMIYQFGFVKIKP